MEEELLNLRGSLYQAAGDFYQAQLAFTRVVATRRPHPEIQTAIRAALQAVKPYDAALNALLQYWLTLMPVQGSEKEMCRTLKLLTLLCNEEAALSRLSYLYLPHKAKIDLPRIASPGAIPVSLN